MFKILQKTIATGIVTRAYPAELAQVSEHFRGRPHFDFEKWTDARPGAEVCPTGAISLRDSDDSRKVTVDYGLCVFCGLCAEASPGKAVRITQEFELATKNRRNLILTAEYTVNGDRTHRQMGDVHLGARNSRAVGACGISGGIFGKNYASLGGVDNVVPVDVYIPGCPPRPQALLHGILLAVGRLAEKR